LRLTAARVGAGLRGLRLPGRAAARPGSSSGPCGQGKSSPAPLSRASECGLVGRGSHPRRLPPSARRQ
jgi:hypothetical protein